jgi:hypothetical protein
VHWKKRKRVARDLLRRRNPNVRKGADVHVRGDLQGAGEQAQGCQGRGAERHAAHIEARSDTVRMQTMLVAVLDQDTCNSELVNGARHDL